MARDLHKEPFDEGTKVKLSIFRDYLRTWLAICSTLPWIRNINIFDFFSGPGQDVTGYKGTPLIIIDELAPYLDKFNKLSINLYFNEYDKNKLDSLKLTVNDILKDQPRNLKIQFDSLDFKDSFAVQKEGMKLPSSMNLLFLDQSGIRHISEDVFLDIIKIKRTDFLFFISSSTKKRFADLPVIQQHIRLEAKTLAATPYHQIHRLVLDYYKGLIPTESEYYLGPFSLKKNSGLYGLIFGSGSILGMQKFLETCWKVDPDRGEANFDIDDDRIVQDQRDLFTGQVPKPKKRDLFERELRENILSKKLRSDKDIYVFSITSGFLPKDARHVVSQLEKDGLISKKRLDLRSTICKKPRAELTLIDLL